MVAVGPPGSGKSYICKQFCLQKLHKSFGCPRPSEYAIIDPDYYIQNHLNNNNACRGLANFCNHQHFMTAISYRRPLLFDGTGKSILNTCSRVIARLKSAGYDVYINVVVASWNTCVARIAERSRETGRDVPLHIVRDIFVQLHSTIPVYLGRQQELCQAVLVYENDEVRCRYTCRPPAVTRAVTPTVTRAVPPAAARVVPPVAVPLPSRLTFPCRATRTKSYCSSRRSSAAAARRRPS